MLPVPHLLRVVEQFSISGLAWSRRRQPLLFRGFLIGGAVAGGSASPLNGEGLNAAGTCHLLASTIDRIGRTWYRPAHELAVIVPRRLAAR